jgi:predicted deacetylase
MFAWALLKAELRQWARAGQRPQLWWRDDDAGSLTPALERLVACAAKASAPLSLAVIPDRAEAGLALYLNPRPWISVLQHGVDHRNDCLSGQQSQFADQVPAVAVSRRLAWAWARLEMFESRLPVYVPPWNAMGGNVVSALPASGLTAVSAWNGMAEPNRLDVHLDLLRWRSGPRFAGEARFLSRLRRALKLRRRAGLWREPIGLLTHHLDHDEAAWRFLDALTAFEPLRRLADWRCVQDLLRLKPVRAEAMASSEAPVALVS